MNDARRYYTNIVGKYGVQVQACLLYTSNLRELYPDVYTTDFFVDVAEEVMETIRAAERAEAAYERKMYRYKAQYSLDCENGIENAVLLKPQTPERCV